jgi:hypothetical protein
MFKPLKDDNQPAVEGEALEENEYKKKGVMLYLGLSMALFTGSFRLTARKQFIREVTFGFVLDIVYIVAMFYIQGVNNAASAHEQLKASELLSLSRMQTIPLVLKLICLGMWPIEIFMFVLEICRKKNLENAPLNVNYNETERRAMFGLQYLRLAYIAFTLIVVGSLVLIFTVKQKKCGPKQSLSWWVVCSDCEVENCIDCFASGEKSCNMCELGMYYSKFRN